MVLSDKSFMDRLFADMQPTVSELSFADLYLFRNAHDYSVTMAGDAPVILGRGYNGDRYFLPPLAGGINEAIDELISAGFSLYGADEMFVSQYLQRDDIEVVEDRDNFDYVYYRSDLAELPGNRYHKKKNRVSYFAGRHNYTVELLSERTKDGCINVVNEWERIHSDENSRSVRPEAAAAIEAVKLADILGLQGVVVSVEGEVKAFVLGERLNIDTSVCRFEKSCPFYGRAFTTC